MLEKGVFVSNTTQNIIEKYWDWQVPVKEYLFFNSNFSLHLNNDIDCYCSIELIDQKYIFNIDNKMTEHNKRFFIFYCFAYYYSKLIPNHNERVEYGDFSYENAGFNKRFSMNFAFDIMIPKDAINYFLFKKKMKSITDLALAFNVSELHMSIQLERLNILPKNFNGIKGI